MKISKSLFLLLFFVGLFFSRSHAQDTAGQETSFERQLRERDTQPVRELVQSKENIDLERKDRNLEISGDVRFEWNYLYEEGKQIFAVPESYDDQRLVEEYRILRGGKSVDFRGLPVSRNDFDVEFNFKVKYTFQNAWMAAHLQFDNSAGIKGFNDCVNGIRVIELQPSHCSSSDDNHFVFVQRDSREAVKGSGESGFVNLKRAYMGYNVWADGERRFDIEIGRRKLDDIFDSEIQFSNRFDGILLKYVSSIKDLFDWYFYFGTFVIDERVNQFGYAFEVGFLDIKGTGLDLKYSFIDWIKRGKNRCFLLDPIGMEFQNSQFTFDYHFKTEICKKSIPCEFYGAFIINHAARESIFTHGRKANLAWYIGLYINNADKKGDWSVDIMYQVVQAQAINENDVGGVSRGNILDERLTDIVAINGVDIDEIREELGLHEESIPSFTDSCAYCLSSSSYSDFLSSLSSSSCGSIFILPRRGNTNFVAWKFEFLYMLTDNLSVDTTYQFSWAENNHIGGRHHYSDFEIEMIYAF